MNRVIALAVFVATFYVGLSLQASDRPYFTPFGPGQGDATLYRNDDGYSGAIPFSFIFKYFGARRTSLYVCNNGIISFDSGVSQFTPQGLPGAPFALMAAYWADIDTRPSNGGFVYYRETSNAAQLAEVSAFVRDTMQVGFVGVKMFVITWFECGYYSYHVDKRVTFQAILVANASEYSAVIYNYGNLEWVTGDASGGVNGFGGTPGVAGFSDGRGTAYAELPGGLTEDVKNLNQKTNAYINGVPQTGRFVFYVSNPFIPTNNDPCCYRTDAQPTWVSTPQTSITVATEADIPAVYARDVCSSTQAVATRTELSSSCTGKVFAVEYTSYCGSTIRFQQTVTFASSSVTVNAPPRVVVQCEDYYASNGAAFNPSNTGTATTTPAGASVQYSDSGNLNNNCASDSEHIVYSLTRTWYTCAGATAIQHIDLASNTAPYFTPSTFPSTVQQECGSSYTPTPQIAFTCVGLASSVGPVTTDHASSCLAVGSRDISYTFTDTCGNTRTETQTIVYSDTVAPTVDAPETCIFPLNNNYYCMPMNNNPHLLVTDTCATSFTHEYLGCTNSNGDEDGCYIDGTNICMRATSSLDGYSIRYRVSDSCGNSVEAHSTFVLADGNDCASPDTVIVTTTGAPIIPSCDSGSTSVSDAYVTIDNVVIDFVGQNGQPGQYRVEATMHFPTLMNDWRLSTSLPNSADEVVHWGQWYSVYNGGTFTCGGPSSGQFTLKPAGGWTVGVSTVNYEYVVTNNENLSESDIIARTVFTLYRTASS